jgi:hypothetical protein
MIKIGVTGHRDIKKSCIKFYSLQVYKLLSTLKKKYKNIVILSSIANGADRLVVYEAIKLNIPYTVVLPMEKELYKIDFNKDSTKQFEILLDSAIDVITLPLKEGNTTKLISQYNKFRDSQYEFAGHYIANNCNNLLALWDGKYIGLTGGTGEIVKYYKTKKNFKLFHFYVLRENI